MKESERVAYTFLTSLQIGPVIHEPDGQNPPDFLVDGRIAVEARRLNENVEMGGVHRGLEVTTKPLHGAVTKALAQSGPSIGTHSWFVHYTVVRRPLPHWRTVERLLRAGVQAFREQLPNPPLEIRLSPELRLSFHPASRTHDTLLVLGGSSDHDAGGFLLAELIHNLQICIEEKVHKVSRVRDNYPEWWLVFEDRISYGALDANDVEPLLRAAMRPLYGFSRILLVNPQDAISAIEI